MAFEKNIAIRTSDEKFMGYLRRYYEQLVPYFLPYLSTNGGPIIAVAVENEYGSFGNDAEYIKAVGDLLRELGVDVPLFTANGIEAAKMTAGSRSDYWTMIDAHEVNFETTKFLRKYQPDKPVAVAEFWAGRSQQWGGYFLRQNSEQVAELYLEALQMGAFVNFYMFCGGTNFGFHNGALVGRYGADVVNAPNRYIPFATSYDVDAPVNEYGQPTEKYYACKRVLKEYMEKNNYTFEGTDEFESHVCQTQSIKDVKLTKSADFLENTSNLSEKECNSSFPLTFEDMDQDYGFMLYTTYIPYTDGKKRAVTIQNLHDRATIYANGQYIGCLMRDREMPVLTFDVPKDGTKLEILVENMGRVNYGCAMLTEKKGICGYVRIEVINDDGSVYPWNYGVHKRWKNTSLPCRNMSLIDFSKEVKHNRPSVFEGTFQAKPGIDTFFNPKGWEKGFVEINGFNIGRYWKVGPQGTLYVPGELLKEENVIRVMEIHDFPENKTVCFDAVPSLDIIEKTCDLHVSVVG